jgi:hypothetical protein
MGLMKPKVKKVVKWLVIIFFVFPLVLAILISFVPTSDENDATTNVEAKSPSLVCVKATSKDLKNLKEGLTDKSLSLTGGFTGEFEANDIEDIKTIFPTYIKPRVVAARINVPDKGIVVGLWGIQDFDYGWKILGLNEEARTYSVYGADTEDDSASGRVRSKMLELSPKTSALNCATASATP